MVGIWIWCRRERSDPEYPNLSRAVGSGPTRLDLEMWTGAIAFNSGGRPELIKAGLFLIINEN